MSSPAAPSLLSMPPVPALLSRLKAEAAAGFDLSRPLRVARSPARLDVMGGIADYTGSLVCQATLANASAVAIQPRPDPTVQILSFDLLDAHEPFTLSIPLAALATTDTPKLAKDFAQPGRRFAAYIAGCLHILHRNGLIDLNDPAPPSHPALPGLSIALHSTVPLGSGVSSSAAVEVATMLALMDHYALRSQLDPLTLAALCQQTENQVALAPCGIMDQVASCAGRENQLLLLRCQPHDIQGFAQFPTGVTAFGIHSGVKHAVGGGQYGKTRTAAFIGHALLLDLMRSMAQASGHALHGDPMRKYLANLNHDDYKNLFRPHLPESLTGAEFLAKKLPYADTATQPDPAVTYTVRDAVDHHVQESHRVTRFVQEISAAQMLDPADPGRKIFLDRAGHLMYASHKSYSDCAHLGAPECDVLVDLVRANEPGGLYGAKITGGGQGGTVAVLANDSPQARSTIAQIMDQYRQKTGLTPTLFDGSSPGGWTTGSAEISL